MFFTLHTTAKKEPTKLESKYKGSASVPAQIIVEPILSAETRKWCLNTAQDTVAEGKVSDSALSELGE